MWKKNKRLLDPEHKLEKKQIEDYYFNYPGQFDYEIVDNCYAYAKEIPDQQNIHKIYEKYYTHSYAKSFSRRWIDKFVKIIYKNRLLNLLVRATPLYIIIHHLYYGISQSNVKILDYGCGNGEQSRFVQENNTWVGFDFDPKSLETGRKMGLEIFSDFDELVVKSSTISGFDFIIMSHILEHVNDPLETLEMVSELLAEGGKILIYTPNIEAFGRLLSGKYWRGYEAPRHFHLFSPKSLINLVAKSKKIEIVTAKSTTRGNRNFMIAFLNKKGFPQVVCKFIGYCYQLISWFLSIFFSRRAGEELFAVIKKKDVS